jgi:hypothetical protein
VPDSTHCLSSASCGKTTDQSPLSYRGQHGFHETVTERGAAQRQQPSGCKAEGCRAVAQETCRVFARLARSSEIRPGTRMNAQRTSERPYRVRFSVARLQEKTRLLREGCHWVLWSYGVSCRVLRNHSILPIVFNSWLPVASREAFPIF